MKNILQSLVYIALLAILSAIVSSCNKASDSEGSEEPTVDSVTQPEPTPEPTPEPQFEKGAKVGDGDGEYQVVRNWPLYPEGKSLGSLHGDMAADSKGKVYIATAGNIQVIGADGVYEKDFKTTDGKVFQGVHGMKIRMVNGVEALIAAMPGKKRVFAVKLDGTVL